MTSVPVLSKNEDYMKKVAKIVGGVDRSISKAGYSSATHLAGARRDLFSHLDADEKKHAERVAQSANIARRKIQKEALENEIEKVAKRPQTSTSSFKVIPRENAPIYKKDKNNLTNPGQYDVNYDLVDHTILVPRWVKSSAAGFHRQEKDENYKFYLEGELLSTNDGKGNTNIFKSKTGRSKDKPKFIYENDFLDVAETANKLKYREDRSVPKMSQAISRNKALELQQRRIQPEISDLAYKTVDPDVYRTKNSKGVINFGKYVDRKTARKGSKLMAELAKDDVENNQQTKLPNWSILQHSNAQAFGMLATGVELENKSAPKSGVDLSKTMSRNDTPKFKQMMWTPLAYFNELNASDNQRKRDAEQEVERFKKDRKSGMESKALASQINAHSKTHPNIPFLCHMDKQLPRPNLKKANPWDNQDFYDISGVVTSKNYRVPEVTAMKKRKGKPTESDNQFKIDESYTFHDVPLEKGEQYTHNFAKDTSRDNVKSGNVSRFTRETTDIFYEPKLDLVEPRVKGDPLIRHQLPRDNVKNKMFKAQHNFQLDFNEVYENVIPKQDLKKGWVEMKRRNPKRFPDVNVNDVPPIGTYNPTW